MIPYFLEKLIHEGKAEAKTFSTACAENAILPVPKDTYIVIYEYWYKPLERNLGDNISSQNLGYWNDRIQFVNFYNATGYNVYWHEFTPGYNMPFNDSSGTLTQYQMPMENPTWDGVQYFDKTVKTTDKRSVYIKTDRDLSIYFTLMNAETPSVGQSVEPNFSPANNYFGYAGYVPGIADGINGYHSLIAQGYNYQPLNDQITNEMAPGVTGDIRNLMYTDPNYGGAFPFFNIYGATINGFPGSALGKVRAQHFQANYVQVNLPDPKNLI